MPNGRAITRQLNGNTRIFLHVLDFLCGRNLERFRGHWLVFAFLGTLRDLNIAITKTRIYFEPRI